MVACSAQLARADHLCARTLLENLRGAPIAQGVDLTDAGVPIVLKPSSETAGLVHTHAGDAIGSYLISSGLSGAVHGAIWTEAGSWLIEPGPNATARITPVAGGLPECSVTEAVLHPAPPPLLEPETLEPQSLDTVSLLTLAADDPAAIRVLIVVEPGAAAKAGDVDVYAAALIASANAALADSLAGPARFELAAVAELALPAWADSGTETLYAAAGRHDGALDEAIDIADAVAADLVAVIVDLRSFCGIAFQQPGDADYGVAVVDYDCALGNLSFAHELGHTLGCAHAPGDFGSGGGAADYAAGHRWGGGQYRSVMAYAPGFRVPRFSNPDVLYEGEPTGIQGQRDNARTIREQTLAVTSHRYGSAADVPDCNTNGTPDAVEIAEGAADINGDGIPDACQQSIDCNANGRSDLHDLGAWIEWNSGRIGPIGGAPISFGSVPLPPPGSEVTLRLAAFAGLGGSGRELNVTLNSTWSRAFFQSEQPTCVPINAIEEFTFTAAEFAGLLDAGGGELQIYFDPGEHVDPSACLLATAAAVSVSYRAASDGFDLNADGIIDTCACFTDLTGSTQSGSPPDGIINGIDLSWFVELWLAGSITTDLTSLGANPGDLDWGRADGRVDGPDLGFFVEAWLDTAGNSCPSP